MFSALKGTELTALILKDANFLASEAAAMWNFFQFPSWWMALACVDIQEWIHFLLMSHVWSHRLSCCLTFFLALGSVSRGRSAAVCSDQLHSGLCGRIWLGPIISAQSWSLQARCLTIGMLCVAVQGAWEGMVSLLDTDSSLETHRNPYAGIYHHHPCSHWLVKISVLINLHCSLMGNPPPLNYICRKNKQEASNWVLLLFLCFLKSLRKSFLHFKALKQSEYPHSSGQDEFSYSVISSTDWS